MKASNQDRDPVDPLSRKGIFRILKNWYWIFVLFFAAAIVLGTFLVDEEKLPQERRYAIHFIGSFSDSTTHPEHRIDHLERAFNGRTDSSLWNEKTIALDQRTTEVFLDHYSDGRFASYMEWNGKVPLDTLHRMLQEALRFERGEKKVPERADSRAISYEVIYSSSWVRIDDAREKKVKNFRAYTVILVMSLFIAFFVALMAERMIQRR